MTIEERYQWACTDVDIGALIPVLRKYGEQCEHITEFGVRHGASTSAWLAAKPKKLVCYDVGHYPSVDEIAKLSRENGIAFEFHKDDTANVVIQETDLLFIDTVHNGSHLNIELFFNSEKVRKWIILHDTHTYGIVGEEDGGGMWYCLYSLLPLLPWRIFEHRPESNGLTVLSRI